MRMDDGIDYWGTDMFGVWAGDLKLKKDVRRRIQASMDDNDISKDEQDPHYYDIDDFALDCIDLDCEWTGEGNKYDDVPYVIGIPPAYPWKQKIKYDFGNEDAARYFIAQKLLPFVDQDEEELEKLCRYYEIVGAE